MLYESKEGVFLDDVMETVFHIDGIPETEMLACYVRPNPQRIRIHLIRQISPTEMLEINNSLTQIGDFNN